MGKPADQTSTNGANGAGDAADEAEIDLTAGLDGGDGDDDDDDNGNAGAGTPDPSDTSTEAIVQRAVAAALAGQGAETDRRVNQALAKQAKKFGLKAKDDDDDDDDDDAPKAKAKGKESTLPVADVREARIAFREYLPEKLGKFVTAEERTLANEIGLALIGSKARKGFDDGDEVGEEVAEKVTELIKTARSSYSKRTRDVLNRQGALKPPANQGQSSNQGAGTDDATTALARAQAKDRELYPERYQTQQ